jgi:trimethylamine---corrinoid protein Co-methyltransferase
MIDRLLRGISVTDETPALDIIDKVGPGRHFLRQKHTIKHLEEEHFFPKLSDRYSYEVWTEKRKKAIHERARDRVKNILIEHEPLPLDSSAEKELLKIIKEVENKTLMKESFQQMFINSTGRRR